MWCWMRQGKSLVVEGPPDTGKSHDCELFRTILLEEKSGCVRISEKRRSSFRCSFWIRDGKCLFARILGLLMILEAWSKNRLFQKLKSRIVVIEVIREKSWLGLRHWNGKFLCSLRLFQAIEKFEAISELFTFWIGSTGSRIKPCIWMQEGLEGYDSKRITNVWIFEALRKLKRSLKLFKSYQERF